ncbi:MAG: hypothetical protein ACOZJX_13090 [Pseudomonadota bacterium]
MLRAVSRGLDQARVRRVDLVDPGACCQLAAPEALVPAREAIETQACFGLDEPGFVEKRCDPGPWPLVGETPANAEGGRW